MLIKQVFHDSWKFVQIRGQKLLTIAMLITRIIAENFKTYAHLDLDLSVHEGKPLVLIGGANGGGKTTFFQAVTGALYGLRIPHQQHFNELYNAGFGASQSDTSEQDAEQNARSIMLAIHFTGSLAGEEKPFVLTRKYEIAEPFKTPKTSGKPTAKNAVIEHVHLSVGRELYAYSTDQPQRERLKQQGDIQKLVKANLPEELSRYFLFDAMESGALLREDEIVRVVQENIESVMGFSKYIRLGRVAETLSKRYNAERLKQENEKNEYLRLVNEQRALEMRLETLESDLKTALDFRRKNTALYDALKADLAGDQVLMRTMEQTKKEIESILTQERAFQSDSEAFVRAFEQHVALPNLASALKRDIGAALQSKSDSEKRGAKSIPAESVRKIVRESLRFLRDTLHETTLPDNTEERLTDYILTGEMSSAQADFYPFLNNEEIRALENLVRTPHANPFPALNEQRTVLESRLERVPELEAHLEEWRTEAASKDFSLIRTFERNEAAVEFAETELLKLAEEMKRIQARLHEFDIHLEQERSAAFDIVQKLQPFFTAVGETLLQAKKRQIELRMMQDLNINLVPYRGVIDRVELSDSLHNLGFRMIHTSGNEITLRELNTASKQIVVQCLLKALHEFGEYNPPVMIDTVMGALDETSRRTVLDHYFPELAHQTILLSSDSEIRPESDFERLKPHIARAYTLHRDKERQYTEVVEGYFGRTLVG
jgi:DNA sulfur modification protein DndD